MKSLCFAICSALLFSTFATSQGSSPNAKVKSGEPRYERATLLRMTARARTHTQELFHSSLLDSPIITEKIVSYDYVVRVGTQRYGSAYTPAKQPGNMPDSWWQGNAPVEVRVVSHDMFIRQPGGNEVKSRIVSHVADK